MICTDRPHTLNVWGLSVQISRGRACRPFPSAGERSTVGLIVNIQSPGDRTKRGIRKLHFGPLDSANGCGGELRSSAELRLSQSRQNPQISGVSRITVDHYDVRDRNVEYFTDPPQHVDLGRMNTSLPVLHGAGTYTRQSRHGRYRHVSTFASALKRNAVETAHNPSTHVAAASASREPTFVITRHCAALPLVFGVLLNKYYCYRQRRRIRENRLRCAHEPRKFRTPEPASPDPTRNSMHELGTPESRPFQLQRKPGPYLQESLMMPTVHQPVAASLLNIGETIA